MLYVVWRDCYYTRPQVCRGQLLLSGSGFRRIRMRYIYIYCRHFIRYILEHSTTLLHITIEAGITVILSYVICTAFMFCTVFVESASESRSESRWRRGCNLVRNEITSSSSSSVLNTSSASYWLQCRWRVYIWLLIGQL